MNAIPIDNLRILKVATCPSLSRASQITYHLALKEEQVYLRIAANSGGGLFAKECVALEAIITAIQAQGDQPITGNTLRPLFQGKSANTPGFALAAARDLGLIVARPGTDGGYQGGNAQPCREAIAALIAAGTAIPIAAPVNRRPVPLVKRGKTPPASPVRPGPRSVSVRATTGLPPFVSGHPFSNCAAAVPRTPQGTWRRAGARRDG